MATTKTRKKQARRKTGTRKKPTPPWVWLLIGLVLGLIAALAVYLYSRTDTAATPEPIATESKPKVKKPKEKVVSAPTKETKPRFDFYRLLPEREIVIPEEDITASPSKKSAPIPEADKSGQYVLQAGAFKTLNQADQLKAKLALIGVHANIETVKINDAVAWHRVRLGPFKGLDEVNTVRFRLQDNDIDSVVLKVN